MPLSHRWQIFWRCLRETKLKPPLRHQALHVLKEKFNLETQIHPSRHVPCSAVEKFCPVFGCHFNAHSSDDIVIYVLKTFAGEVKVGGRESVHVLLVSTARQSLSHWLGRISLKAIVPKSRECFLLLFSPVSSFLSHASLNAFRAFREKKGKSSKVLVSISSVGSLRRNGGNTLGYSKETFSLCWSHCLKSNPDNQTRRNCQL